MGFTALSRSFSFVLIAATGRRLRHTTNRSAPMTSRLWPMSNCASDMRYWSWRHPSRLAIRT